jgi:two-component system OmpR family sensor kinase/two-component system sensor histidine kinase BaeS
MNRLWVRLTLAFTLVVLVAVGAIAILISYTTGAEFRQYVTHSGMRASGSGMQQLAAYYEEQGSWEGVEALLEEGVFVTAPLGGPMAGPNRRPGMPGRRLDAVLADATGKVVYDSAGQDEGKRLSSRERSRALSITGTSSDEVIGYLLLSFPGRSDPLGNLEQQFLQRMRNLLFAGAAVAVGLGLVMGALLSRSLTAPLQRLAAAARAVAAGDLGRQVEVEGSVEMAEVGQAFNEMTAALEEAETLRQNLVADVAHELRTPLSVVQGNLRAILDDVYPLDKAEVSRLYDETRLLSRLVDDLQELALADAGQLPLNVQPTDVGLVVRHTVENLALAAEAQEVTLSAQIPAGLPPVQADPDRIAQVLRNLSVNALRHTPPGGSVTITASALAGAVEIAVTDTGEGIAPDDLPHVFERFWRAERSRQRSDRWVGGTGLGLSVAQSLVEAQGGRIWAESVHGQGATFRFTLPLATESS